RSVGVGLRGRRLNRLHPNTVRLHVPVGGPHTAVEGRLNRQTAVPTEDSGGLPTAKDLLHRAACVTKESLASSKRQAHHPVGIDDMSRIKIRTGVVFVWVQGIDDELGSVTSGVLQARDAVERMTVSVVEVK